MILISFRKIHFVLMLSGDLWISWEEGMKVFDELLLDAGTDILRTNPLSPSVLQHIKIFQIGQ